MVVNFTFHLNPAMQTSLLSHLLHSGHILLTSALWDSSTLDSWQPASLLPRARTLPSIDQPCWAYCQMPLSTSQAWNFKAMQSWLQTLSLLVKTSPMLTMWFFFRRKSRPCCAWEYFWSGRRVTTFILRSHCWSTGPKSSNFSPEKNLCVIDISFLETRGVLYWSV